MRSSTKESNRTSRGPSISARVSRGLALSRPEPSHPHPTHQTPGSSMTVSYCSPSGLEQPRGHPLAVLANACVPQPQVCAVPLLSILCPAPARLVLPWSLLLCPLPAVSSASPSLGHPQRSLCPLFPPCLAFHPSTNHPHSADLFVWCSLLLPAGTRGLGSRSCGLRSCALVQRCWVLSRGSVNTTSQLEEQIWISGKRAARVAHSHQPHREGV